LIILLLGYGLVAVPRRLWESGDLIQQNRFYQFEAFVLDESVVDSRYHLDETVKVIYTAMQRAITDVKLQAELATIVEQIPLDILEHHRCIKSHESRAAEDALGEVTEERLVELHRDLKRNLSEYTRAQW
jgi:hypothetical protein